MRWWILLAFAAGCGGDDSSNGMIDAGANGDGMHADAPKCTGGTAAMSDPTTGHCYILYVNLVNYAAAKTACGQTAGFHLVRIETANEQSLVTTLVGLDIAWTGGTDIASEGTYVWDNGTPITMFHWLSGQPDNGGGGTAQENCIGIDGARSGGWNDLPCMQESGTSVPYTYAYVCEHD